jgi:hypothetical protein
MKTDFIKLGKYSYRGSLIDGPSLIIPRKSGKTYSIQYGGCACLSCTVKGNIFKLPAIKFGNPEGTIFNSDFWYGKALSKYWDMESNSVSVKNARSFIYDLIEDEIDDRCCSWNKNYTKRIWNTPYKNIKIVRNYKNNNEAMMLVSFINKNRLEYGVLTWDNCD